MANNQNALRPEAGPIPYWKHHKRAKEALNFIIRVLRGAADSVQGSKGVGGDQSIDTSRASRIVFISGEPGSGKSTLYLTLRAMLSSEEYRKGYKGDFGNLTKAKWLDALDLEIAGDEGENLLAAVLVRLFRKLEVEESSPIRPNDCAEAIKELEELATDIGIAWEGNLQARAGSLDPDTFSTEVIRTQGARLRINQRLKEALDRLAKNKCYGCDENTLFVLPVDDFYLKPAASLELLRLLRMISIPRLFFLVMGDINTVEALFIEKSLADWTDVAGTGLFATRSERLDEALTRARELRARYLRKLLPPFQRADIEAMDWFEALDFTTGNTDDDDDPNDTLEKLLEEVELDEPLTESGRSGETLRTFLISPALPSTESNEWKDEKAKRRKRAKREAKDDEKEDQAERNLKKIRSAYTALQIMDATPREIMDLGFALREVRRIRAEEVTIKREEFKNGGIGIVDDDKIPQLLLSVRDIVNLVREEQSFLNEEEQKVLEGILPTRHYSPEDTRFAMDRLCLKPTKRNWENSKEEKENPHPLWFRDQRSWDLSVNRESITGSNKKGTSIEDDSHEDEGSEKADTDPYAKLPPRQAAWYVLLHDLAWKWNPNSVAGNLVKKLCKDLNEWELEDTGANSPPSKPRQRFITKPQQNLNPSGFFIGWAVYLSKGAMHTEGSTYKHFPMPEFEIFRDLDRFLFIWSSGIKWLKKPEEVDLSKISSLWALAGWTVLTEAYTDFAHEGDKWFEDFVITKGDFVERFEEFKEKLSVKGVTFQPPSHKSAEITRWLDELVKLPNQFQSAKEASTSSDHLPNDAPQRTG